MLLNLRRSIFVSVLIAVVLVAGALGVSRGNTFAKTAPAKHAQAMTKVFVILNWLPNVEFDGLWVAQQKGWFKKAGIDLGFKGWAPGVTPETDVPARGGNTFGFQSGAAIAIARSRGVPIKSLYADTQKSVFGLTVLASSPVHKLTDLRGKKIGYQSHELYVPETMMSCRGLTAGSDYKTVPVGFDTSALTSGQVDAYLTFVTNEPIGLRLQGVATRTFRAADYCFHSYDDVLFATDSLIKSNPALVRTFTSVVARGFTWAHSHPDVAARLTVAHYFPASAAGSGVTARANQQQQILESRAFSPFAKDSHGVFSGRMSTSYWQDLINILFKYHQINHKITPGSVFTNRFNPNTM